MTPMTKGKPTIRHRIIEHLPVLTLNKTLDKVRICTKRVDA